MCAPVVMDAVHQEVSRRGFLRLAGAAAVAALGAQALGPDDAAAAATPRFRNVQDLTHTLRPGFPAFSGDRLFESSVASTVGTGGFYALRVSYHEHIGTHIDAPAHFGDGAPTVDRVEPAALIAPVAVVDIRDRAARDHDARLTADDVRDWERRHGRLPRGCAVFMHSGWEARVGSARAFRNADASGVLHFPGFHPDAAAFLLREREVVGIGVDTLSLDAGASRDFRTHRTWLPAGRWGLENLASLPQIPESGAWVIVGAPKVAGGSGGPSRVIAVW